MSCLLILVFNYLFYARTSWNNPEREGSSVLRGSKLDFEVDDSFIPRLCDICWLIVSLYAYMYVNKETWIESNANDNMFMKNHEPITWLYDYEHCSLWV